MTFQKAEPWIFRLLVLLHLWPVFAVSYFVTHDGPAHVYNAALIRDLLFTGNNPAASDFFQFNLFPSPNWTGHAVMILGSTVFSPAFSEKILVALCIIIPAFSFRSIILQLSPDNGWRSWMIFPFLHGFLLYLGFYNFCLGTGILLFSIAWWQKNKNKNTNSTALIFAGLMLLLYFSHLFTLLMFLVYLFVATFRERISNSAFPQGRLKYYMGLIIPVTLSVFFVLQQPSTDKSALATSELVHWLLEGRTMITLHYENQVPFTATLGILLTVLFLFTFCFRFLKERAIRTSDVFFLCAVISLLFYFFFPNNAGEGGFISVRFLLFFYLFILIWIILNIRQKWILWAANIVFLGVSIKMLLYHNGELQILSDNAVAYTSANSKIKPGTIVLPLNYSDNWLHSNLSGYVGAETSSLVLDNYEAAKSVFPLRWKEGMDPYKIIGGFSASIPPCGEASDFQKSTINKRIAYVLRWMYEIQADSCTLNWNNFLDKNGFIRDSLGMSAEIKLYKLK